MSVEIGNTINSYGGYYTQSVGSVTSKMPVKATETASEKASEAKTTPAAVYEKSEGAEKKATYSINKMSAEERATLVEKMKQDQLDRRNQLSSLVQQMFSKQTGVSNLADLFSPENLKSVSAKDIAQAKEDVSEDGYWGVKQTSQRLFDFASALAGDDVEKMKGMQEAMEKGFKLATKDWGRELPNISKDTLNAANKLFEDYYASKNGVEIEA